MRSFASYADYLSKGQLFLGEKALDEAVTSTILTSKTKTCHEN